VPPARAASPVPAEPAGSDSSIEVIIPSAANVPGRIRGGGPSDTDEQVIRDSWEVFFCLLQQSGHKQRSLLAGTCGTHFLSVVKGRIVSSL
jgi:hypothetical protein